MKEKFIKIRGYGRKLNHVKQWVEENKTINKELLEEYKYYSAEIIIHPWCDISLINSIFPEPKGKMKQEMIRGLIDIYHSWKTELESIGKPYYLKIWIFEPYFSKSQVVCGIEDNIEFYENRFSSPDIQKSFNANNYGGSKEQLEQFGWEQKMHEITYDDDYITGPVGWKSVKKYQKALKWFRRKLKQKHTKIQHDDGSIEHFFHVGDIWIGGIK